MRVANKVVYDTIKYNLGNLGEDMSKVNTIASTGKRITELSDDPVGLTQALNIKSSIANIDQLGRNLSLGRSWLSSAESALSQVQELISDAKTIAIHMGTSTTGPPERVSEAQTIKNMLEEIISLANTESNGRYVFAGSKTDSMPFDQNGSYGGDNNAFTIKIGRDTSVQIGGDGGAVFGSVFSTFSDLKTALETNDVNGVQAAIDLLDIDFDHITTGISAVGVKTHRLEIKENIYQDLEIANTDRLSQIVEADIADAITDLKAMELAYQVALSSSARVMELNLFDYI